MTKLLRILCIVFVCACPVVWLARAEEGPSAAPPGPRPTPGVPIELARSRQITGGDILSVDVLSNLDSLAHSSVRLLLNPHMIVLVDADGVLSLGASYGGVKITGKTLSEAETAIVSTIRTGIAKTAVNRNRAGEEKVRAFEPGDIQINVRLMYLGHESGDEPTLLLRETSGSTGMPQSIVPGDILQIESLVDGLNVRRSVVEPDGSLALGPRWGRINVAGRSVIEAESAVREHIAEHVKDPEIQVTFSGHSRDWSAGSQLQSGDAGAMLRQFERDVSELKAMLSEFKSLKLR